MPRAAQSILRLLEPMLIAMVGDHETAVVIALSG